MKVLLKQHPDLKKLDAWKQMEIGKIRALVGWDFKRVCPVSHYHNSI